MEYKVLKDCYGFAGGKFLMAGQTVFITDEEKEACDETYFATLFAAIHVPAKKSTRKTNDKEEK